MEKQMGVWIDKEKAILISLTEEGESIHKIESEVETRVRFTGEKKGFHRLGGMLANPIKRKTERQKHQLHNYFKQIIKNIKDANEILILGPAETKKWLEKELKKNNDHIARKVRGVKSADYISENQIIEKVKKFFAEQKPKKR